MGSLLPQTEITINLIRQSNATPNVSAYAHLSGPFDYNKLPLASMGCEAQVHEKPTNAALGHIIWWMDGICSHHLNIIARITATFSTQRANDYPTLFNSNTSALRYIGNTLYRYLPNGMMMVVKSLDSSSNSNV
jgi:hypothetical protein